MNILVIGNGFDLAHGLPTKYTDFLRFCKMIIKIYTAKKSADQDQIWEELKIKKDNNAERMNTIFRKLFSFRKVMEFEDVDDVLSIMVETNTIYDEFYDNIKYNFWIDYFLQNSIYLKENWIDFESEISQVIQSLEKDMHSDLGGNCNVEDKIEKLSNDFLQRRYNFIRHRRSSISFKQIRDDLQRDLLKLIRALEIYLVDFVEKIECNYISPDINSIKVDKVLSFNYTGTYEKIYGNSDIEFDYIHGKANISNTFETNNMVLGTEEYLSDNRKNTDIEFIAFKKFYQRIYNQTGNKYKEWVDQIGQLNERYVEGINKCKFYIEKFAGNREQSKYTKKYIESLDYLKKNPPEHNLFIFGHSLDITDRDILRELILNQNIHTYIFYLDKDMMGQQIANLVKVIEQDELINRTGDNTIQFRKQQKMDNIKKKSERAEEDDFWKRVENPVFM